MNKRIRWLLLIVVGFLTACFLWREKLSLDKTINHEKFDAYFSSLGAIGTALSLYLIYRQILLQADANRLAHSPIVGISERVEFPLEVINNTDDNNAPKQFRVAANFKPGDHSDVNKYHASKFEIFNTGNGAAVDVTFETFYRDKLFIFISENYNPDYHRIRESVDILHARERIEVNIFSYCNWLLKGLNPDDLSQKSGSSYPNIHHYLKLSYSDMQSGKFYIFYSVSGMVWRLNPDKYYYSISFFKTDEETVHKMLDYHKIGDRLSA